MGKLACAESSHHLLKGGPISVLCRVTGVLENHVVGYSQNILAIGGQFFFLNLKRVLVDLPVCRDSDINSGFSHGMSMCGANDILQARFYHRVLYRLV